MRPVDAVQRIKGIDDIVGTQIETQHSLGVGFTRNNPVNRGFYLVGTVKAWECSFHSLRLVIFYGNHLA